MLKSVLLALVVTWLSSPAGAANAIVVNVSTRYQDYCGANSGFVCHDRVKRESESRGVREAAWKCELQHQGRPQRFGARHRTYCNPFSLPHNNPATFVSCNTSTNMRCDLPN